MKKCLIPLLAVLLSLVSCTGNRVSYKGFSFECPEHYPLQKTVTADGMRCVLQGKEPGEIYVVEVVPDFRKEWGLEEAGNKEVGKMMANSVYDLYTRHFSSGKLVLDKAFVIESSEDGDFSPYAYSELAGTLDGSAFKAFISSDLWGENQVTTLILARSEARYNEWFQQVFGTYTWKE